MPVIDHLDNCRKTKDQQKKRKQTNTEDAINLNELFNNNDEYDSACDIIDTISGSGTITERLSKTSSLGLNYHGTVVLEDIEFPLDYESQMALRRELAESKETSPFLLLPVDAWPSSSTVLYRGQSPGPADSTTVEQLNKKWIKLEETYRKEELIRRKRKAIQRGILSFFNTYFINPLNEVGRQADIFEDHVNKQVRNMKIGTRRQKQTMKREYANMTKAAANFKSRTKNMLKTRAKTTKIFLKDRAKAGRKRQKEILKDTMNVCKACASICLGGCTQGMKTCKATVSKPVNEALEKLDKIALYYQQKTRKLHGKRLWIDQKLLDWKDSALYQATLQPISDTLTYMYYWINFEDLSSVWATWNQLQTTIVGPDGRVYQLVPA